ELTELCLEIINLVVDDEVVEERGKWLRVLTLRKTGIEKFSYMCLNLEVLHTDYVCGDIGLGCISKLGKKLRKLTVYSGTCVGLMAVAQGCPNLEYTHVELTDISNEALECIVLDIVFILVNRLGGTAPKKSRRVGSLETVSSMNSKGDYGNTFKGRNWRLKELFKMINIDNSGTITFEELKEGMRRVGSELMESEIKDFDGCAFEAEVGYKWWINEFWKVIKSFNLSVPPRELQNKDPKFVLQSVMSRWLPLSDTILSMVVKHIPDLVNAQSVFSGVLHAGQKVFVLSALYDPLKTAKLDTNGDKRILEKLIKSFNLSAPPRELQNKDPKFVLQSVMSRWLPLSDAILSMVVKHIPDPVNAQSFRISRLLPKREILDSDVGKSDVIAEAELVRKSVEACDSRPEAPYVAFVSKMFAVPIKMLPQRDVNDDIVNNYHEESGSGDSDELATARAGNIVAIRGLGQHILKSATLASTKNCWPFSSKTFQVSPTLKVAIEPSAPTDMAALMEGLRLLNRAEPFIEISVSA
ncbi:elongation factor-like GTPase 1, partial [Tanacetum coccineum]